MNAESRRSTNNVQMVKLSGPLSITRSQDVIQLFDHILSQGAQKILLDLADVPFIDSRGLAALIAGYRMFGSDGRNFQLAGLQDQPRLLLEITKLDTIFHVLERVAEVKTSRPVVSLDLGLAA